MRTKPLSFILNMAAALGLAVALGQGAGLPMGLAYLAGCNAWLTVLLVKDKLMATHVPRGPDRAGYRTPESTLLGLAALGASPALVVGMFLLRHKIRKEAFLAPMLAIIALQAVALYVYGPVLAGWF